MPNILARWLLHQEENLKIENLFTKMSPALTLPREERAALKALPNRVEIKSSG